MTEVVQKALLLPQTPLICFQKLTNNDKDVHIVLHNIMLLKELRLLMAEINRYRRCERHESGDFGVPAPHKRSDRLPASAWDFGLARFEHAR
jgi:hypothetical protein